ncbi:MAG: hypothetical protein HW386_1874 [Gammaproteobacteria bacterium]|nr:hypothetical protein [Gammaproteobacteria bacterium]
MAKFVKNSGDADLYTIQAYLRLCINSTGLLPGAAGFAVMNQSTVIHQKPGGENDLSGK